MDFRFTNEQTLFRTDEIVEHLRGPRLWIPRFDYPDFDEWLERSHEQLKSEKKRALLALSGNTIVGAVVYQKRVGVPNDLEIKNLSVRPDARGRYIANFLLRNAEIEGSKDFKCDRVVLDTKMGNRAIRQLLVRCGYQVSLIEDLYKLGAGRDVTYEKELTRSVTRF